MELNNEQIQILRFLYDHSSEKFSYAQMSKLNIPSFESDIWNLHSNRLVILNGQTLSNYTYQITPVGRAVYEAHVRLEKEKEEHRQAQAQVEKRAHTSFVISVISLILVAAQTVASVLLAIYF